ncbi:MAG TPA: macro domain-containing protein [Paenalcaligenes sp.]|nr:macro domain-containing protein [Paenalcaligenes sp.]
MTMSSATTNKTIAILHGDITAIAADAIVNSANETLLPGGGVSGAIHQAAGPTVAKVCTDYYHTHGEQTAGTVIPTPAGKLSAQYILHAIGPRWQDGHHNEAKDLAQTYQNIIQSADKLGLKSVSIPAISVGIFAFPLDAATKIALNTLTKTLQKSQYVRTVLLVCFNQEITQTYTHISASIATPRQIQIISLSPGYATNNQSN